MANYYIEQMDWVWAEIWADGGPIDCKYCGMPDLWWDETGAGTWRLYDKDGNLHECPEYHKTKDLEKGL